MNHLANPVCQAALSVLGLTLPLQAQEIPSPAEFFRHEIGADRKLARWDELVEYYELIGRASDRVEVRNAGPSTLGHPFLMIFVSSPENLENLDRIQQLNAERPAGRSGPTTRPARTPSRSTACFARPRAARGARSRASP